MTKIFEDLELDPRALVLALVAAIISIIVMSKVEVGIIYKIGAFIGTLIVSYIIVGKILGE